MSTLAFCRTRDVRDLPRGGDGDKLVIVGRSSLDKLGQFSSRAAELKEGETDDDRIVPGHSVLFPF